MVGHRFRRAAATVAAATVVLAGVAQAEPAAADGQQLPSGRTAYRTWDDYLHDMQALATGHPDLVHEFALPNRTIQGRTDHGLEITSHVNRADGKPALLIVGLHHGNEFASGDETMEFGFDLVQHYGHDAQITRLLDTARVVLVPVVNPDGLVADRRVNGEDVDINRNYGFGWQGIPTDENVGTGPFSEPESRNIRDLVSSHQITTFVTMHTCEALILYPPLAFHEGTPQDQSRFVALAKAMAADTGYGYKASADDYQTSGEAISWSYYATRGLGYTIEDCTVPASGSGITRDFQTMVVNQYYGTGDYTDGAQGGMRAAYLTALADAARPGSHATITGRAPEGAVLDISKSFDLWTAPVRKTDGSIGPLPVPTHLTSRLVVGAGGAFDWATNPSLRPVPPYQPDGIHTRHPGFEHESWTLTCSTAGGKVLQRTAVTVELGQVKHVDLSTCRKRWRDRG
ncbi:MAG TPA: M14 family zinc carboxypeptidase [Streptosporangiales bacterium]